MGFFNFAKMNRQVIHVIYEDNHLLVVNKPAGMLVQGDKTGDEPLVERGKTYIKQKYHKPGNVFLGVVHRIDRPVSGVVVLARTSKALERTNALFKTREVKKTYWAITKNKPPRKADRLVHWLIKDPVKNKTKAYTQKTEQGLRAELTYKVLGRLNDHYLLEVCPVTGRPHQIRVQLAAIGCPIRGDLKYGFAKANQNGSINLHAKNLSFIHPVKKLPLLFRASLPEDRFWEQFLVLEDQKYLKNKNINHIP